MKSLSRNCLGFFGTFGKKLHSRQSGSLRFVVFESARNEKSESFFAMCAKIYKNIVPYIQYAFVREITPAKAIFTFRE